ncbi:MAG: TonB-dependent siderophore receptor [Methylotenera sp.]|nr:MAG: TonB-dependent siderophore receptor [Methylotenera sp.]
MFYQSQLKIIHVAVLMALASSAQFATAEESSANATAESPAIEALPEVTVSSTKDESSYQPLTTTTAAKIEAPLRDIPQTINVVPEVLIEDQGARSMQDVLKNVPGVSFNIGDGQRDQFVIRGFDAIGDLFVDGIRDDALYYRDLSNIERVEVVKGPAAVLYGRGSSGGIINRITKKPGISVRDVELTAGSYEQKRATFDFGDALGDSAAFRVTGAVEDSGSFRDEGFLEREHIAPSLALQLSPDTKLLLQVEKLRDRRLTDMGIPAFQGKPAKVDIDTFYGTSDAKDEDYSQSDVLSGRIKLEHTINNSLKIQNTFSSYHYELDRKNTFGQTVNEAARTVRLFHGETQREDDGWFNQLELIQDLTLGNTQHQLLYGTEVGQQHKDLQVINWTTSLPNAAGVRAQSGPNVPLFNPGQPDISAFGVPVLRQDNVTTLKVTSAYVQDLVTLTDHWKALVGVRYDEFKQKVDDNFRGGIDRERTDREWSPRAGVVFQPNNWQSYYVSYSRSFQPSGEVLAFSTTQSELEPEETNNIEVGAKLDFFGGRLSTTASVFHLERENIKNTVPGTNPAQIQSVGTQRTRGLELTAAGEIASRWQVSVGYAYLDAEITDSIATQNTNTSPPIVIALEGNRAALTPRHSANLWLMHDLGSGFSVGGGLNYVGDRYASPDNTVTLESYLTVDAAAIYRSKKYDVALNLKNITDKEYFISGHGASNNLNAPGAPRTAEVSLRLHF